MKKILNNLNKDTENKDGINQKKIWIPHKIKNIRNFQDTIEILPIQLYKVVYNVLEKGYVDLNYISKKFNISQKEASGILEFLTRYRYLTKIKLKGDEDGWALGDVYWIEEKFPSGPVIPFIYQFNLISDIKRTSFFANAINKTVKKGDRVLDIGTGTGIFSILAAKKGGIVYSYEINEKNYRMAQNIIRKNNLQENIILKKEDIFVVDLEKNVEVIICEMFDTALVAEMQVQAMNKAIEFLKDGGKVIPESAATYVELVEFQEEFFDIKFPLIHYEAYGNPKPKKILSEKYKIHGISFYNKNNEEEISTSLKLKTNKNGRINGIRFTTDVYFENEKLSSTEWFNPPIIYPIRELEVKKGDEISLNLYMMFGAGWDNVEINVEGK
jgi:predicted RNA methylase